MVIKLLLCIMWCVPSRSLIRIIHLPKFQRNRVSNIHWNLENLVPDDNFHCVMHNACSLKSLHSGETFAAPTHWGRVRHISVSKLTIIGSDNGLSSGRRQAIIWTNAGILFIRPLGTNFSGILSGIQTVSFKKLHLKTSSAKWHLFCPGLNVSYSSSPS